MTDTLRPANVCRECGHAGTHASDCAFMQPFDELKALRTKLRKLICNWEANKVPLSSASDQFEQGVNAGWNTRTDTCARSLAAILDAEEGK